MTQDFFLGQLRLIAIALIAYAAGKGWLSSADSTLVGAILPPLGLLVGPWLWSIYTNINGKIVPRNSVAIQHVDGTKPDLAIGDTVNSVTKVVGAIVLAFGLTLFSQGDAFAQTPRLTGNIVRDLAPAPAASAGLPDILKAIDAKVLPDIEYAIRLADASGSQLTGDCFKAWRDLITARMKAVTDDKGNEIPEPSPHIITDFEKAVEIRNALQSTSPFMVKCAPVASMIKMDVARFMGLVISGGAGMAALVPGL